LKKSKSTSGKTLIVYELEGIRLRKGAEDFPETAEFFEK